MELRTKVERWKATAEIFLKKDIKVFIKDVDDNIYFADILFVGEDAITFQCFSPKHRAGQNKTLYWPLVLEFEEYRGEQ